MRISFIIIMFVSCFYIILVCSLLTILNLANGGEEEVAALKHSLGLIEKKMAGLKESMDGKEIAALTDSLGLIENKMDNLKESMNKEEVAAVEDSLGLIENKIAGIKESMNEMPNVVSTTEHTEATAPAHVAKEKKTLGGILRGVLNSIAERLNKLYNTITGTKPNTVDAQQLEKEEQKIKIVESTEKHGVTTGKMDNTITDTKPNTVDAQLKETEQVEIATPIEEHAVAGTSKEINSELKSAKKRQNRMIALSALGIATVPTAYLLTNYIKENTKDTDNDVDDSNKAEEFEYNDISEQTNTAEYTAILVLVTIAALGVVLLITTALVYLHSTTKRKPYQDLLSSI